MAPSRQPDVQTPVIHSLCGYDLPEEEEGLGRRKGSYPFPPSPNKKLVWGLGLLPLPKQEKTRKSKKKKEKEK